MRPLFIVVEGLDGTGKSTLASNLARRLKGVAMATPGPVVREQRAALLQELDDQSARALLYMATVRNAGVTAHQLVAEGRTVVMDRYWLSTVAYARARGASLPWKALEAEMPVPDITLLIALDETVRRRRLHDRGMTEADRETLDAAFADLVMTEMQRQDRPLRPSARIVTDGLDPSSLVERATHVIQTTLHSPKLFSI